MREKKGCVLFGKKQIDFQIRRSQRRKTLGICVDPVEGIFVRTPEKAPLKSIEKIVHSKSIWILKKKNEFDEILRYKPVKEFISGESFLYLGKKYRLKIVNKCIAPKLTVCSGNFTVCLKNGIGKAEKIKIIRQLLAVWYKKHAKIILNRRIKYFLEKLGLNMPEVVLNSDTKYWGNCLNPEKISFNWYIIMAPLNLIDYVVAHELCHLIHKNHSKEFWKLLGSIMPDYELRIERLKKSGVEYIF